MVKKYKEIKVQIISTESLRAKLPNKKDRIDEMIGNLEVSLFLSRLTEREKIVVELRMEDKPFKEISKKIGTTEARARKIKAKIKKKYENQRN